MSQPSKEEKLKRKLEALEDRHESQNSNTTRGLVYRLFDTLTEAKAKGYTWAELAEMFSSEQINIKGSTLSYYYRTIKKERGVVEQEKTSESKRQRKGKRKDQSKDDTAEEKLEEEKPNNPARELTFDAMMTSKGFINRYAAELCLEEEKSDNSHSHPSPIESG